MALDAVDGVEPIPERASRAVAHRARTWEEQRAALSTTSKAIAW